MGIKNKIKFKITPLLKTFISSPYSSLDSCNNLETISEQGFDLDLAKGVTGCILPRFSAADDTTKVLK